MIATKVFRGPLQSSLYPKDSMRVTFVAIWELSFIDTLLRVSRFQTRCTSVYESLYTHGADRFDREDLKELQKFTDGFAKKVKNELEVESIKGLTKKRFNSNKTVKHKLNTQ